MNEPVISFIPFRSILNEFHWKFEVTQCTFFKIFEGKSLFIILLRKWRNCDVFYSFFFCNLCRYSVRPSEVKSRRGDGNASFPKRINSEVKSRRGVLGIFFNEELFILLIILLSSSKRLCWLVYQMNSEIVALRFFTFLFFHTSFQLSLYVNILAFLKQVKFTFS